MTPAETITPPYRAPLFSFNPSIRQTAAVFQKACVAMPKGWVKLIEIVQVQMRVK